MTKMAWFLDLRPFVARFDLMQGMRLGCLLRGYLRGPKPEEAQPFA